MTQDTRKDPRAKVLTMTVRYKSATVDEFIEQYSLDISRGGIFIKTSSPFAPGTLLKFEIRIAEDRTVLQGVGRVVWKRDSADAAASRPAGMGVKFIKIDEASKQVIEDLVSRHEGSGAAYEAGLSQGGAAAAAGASDGGAADDGTASPVRKATMIGLGGFDAAAVIAAAQAQAEASAQAGEGGEPAEPAQSSASPFFPETDSEGEMPPPGERTVMRQAAELLQEALLGAGGSMDELGAIGAKPLVDETGQGEGIELPKSGSPSIFPPPRSNSSSQSFQAVPADIPSMPSIASIPPPPPVPADSADLEEGAAAAEASQPPERPVTPVPTPPAPVVAASKEAAAPARSGGGRAFVYLGLVAAAAAGVYFMFGGSPSAPAETPTVVAAPPAEAEKAEPASEPAPSEEEPSLVLDEPTEPAPAASATGAPDKPEPTKEPVPAKEPAAPTRPAVAPVEKSVAAEPAPKPVKPAAEKVAPATEAPAQAPKAAAPKPAAVEAAPAEKPAAPAEKPKAKPKPADDDNPY